MATSLLPSWPASHSADLSQRLAEFVFMDATDQKGTMRTIAQSFLRGN